MLFWPGFVARESWMFSKPFENPDKMILTFIRHIQDFWGAFRRLFLDHSWSNIICHAIAVFFFKLLWILKFKQYKCKILMVLLMGSAGPNLGPLIKLIKAN